MFKAYGSILAAGIASSIAVVSPVQAQSSELVTYTMVAGDTLYDLAAEYFTSAAAARRVQRLNRIDNPRAIPVGAVISVPRSLLKWDPVPLQVASFAGDVQIEQRGQSAAPRKNQLIGENAIVSTGVRSFISLKGEGATALSLPSNSKVQIRSAKKYRLNKTLDVDLRVLRGRGEVTAPSLRENERFRIGTPVAVTAVRGTQFRVAYDDTVELALTEVTEGVVAVSAKDASVTAVAGKGVATDPSGLGQPEQLLSAPKITDRFETQTDEAVSFSISPLSGAVAYRTQIARDITFTDVIDEKVSDELSVAFAEVEDGRYSVRSRAIAQSGLEGMWQGDDASFRRKRVGTTASVEASPFDNTYKFGWLSIGTGPSYTAFQLWPKGDDERLIVDEVGLDISGLNISGLEPGVYTWRVATSVIDEGEVLKVWSEPRDLTVSE